MRFNNNKNSSLYLSKILTYMLTNKKSKILQDKNKQKTGQTAKKSKKSKILSPSKQKATPDTKRGIKDQNLHSIKNPHKTSIRNAQTIESVKSKEKQGYKTCILNKNQGNELKNKLTTSPVLFDRLNSNQKRKSNDKSKSRSFSKSKTYRSNSQRDKSFLKSVSKKLYAHTQQIIKQPSNSKSKSKSKVNLSAKDMTPPRQSKVTMLFNVADRQVKFNKTEQQELKKAVKRKVKNKLKEEVFLYPHDSKIIQQNIEQPIFKCKKKVPQIKTEFSERRGSFFDENLLKRLQIGQYQNKKLQISRFSNIKSSFQQQLQKLKKQHQSKSFLSQKKISNSSSSVDYLKSKQIQNFKRQQEHKWSLMLKQLEKLKGEQIIPQKIDQLIIQLNQNYKCLKQKKSSVSLFSHEQNEAKTKKQINEGGQNQFKTLPNPTKQIESRALQALKEDIRVIRDQAKKQIRLQAQIDNKDVELKRQAKILISKILQKEKTSSSLKQEFIQIKRTHSINLGNDFIDFCQKQHTQMFRRQLFQQETKICQQQIEQISQTKSNHDTFSEQINLIENHSIIEFQKKEIINEHLQSTILINQQISPIINLEINVHEDVSQQSILLKSTQHIQTKPNVQSVIPQIQSTLILQFCSNILKNKQILNNFLTKYSQLVDNNVINVSYADEDFKQKINSSNEYVIQIVKRILNYFQYYEQQLFMTQISLPFQCKTLEILKFIRCVDEEMQSFNMPCNDQNTIIMPFLGMQRIQYFQTQVLANQYYIPNYFSFNHSIYDLFNDVFDQLRPYGSRGKAIFTLQLGHGIKTFAQAAYKITQRFIKSLSVRYYQQPLQQQKCSTQEGIFQIIYFTSLQIMDQIFFRQTLTLYKLMTRTNV